MHIDVITIFPEMFPGVLGASMLKRAQESGRLRVAVHDLRDYSQDKHRKVDDRPYGGGPGMVMRVEPIFDAVETLTRGCDRGGHPAIGGVAEGSVAIRRIATEGARHRSCETILMSPQGERCSSALAQTLSEIEHLLLICGHYEGVDERVKSLVDRSVSIGDYVLTGGELPAMVLIDCVARFVPGVLGHEQATEEESFASGWLEYPQYTRPPAFRGMAVPEILLSGDHERIARWRQEQAVARTLASRPDLVKRPSSSSTAQKG